MSSILIKNGTIVEANEEKKCDVLIENGVITKVGLGIESETAEVIDATGLLIFPGLIDCHVHFREPGLTQKETMATGAAAAVAGGVTTVCEMPNTNPPTVSITALDEKIKIAKRISNCDLRFFFGATDISHLEILRILWTNPDFVGLRDRCCGLKLYLDHSTGDQKAPKGVIDEAFKLCAELKIIVVCHCEDPEMNRADPTRPPESEEKSIKEALALAKKYGTHLHVAHLSTKNGLDLIRAAKKSGITVTCEVAPHHLFLTVDDYASLGTLAKMNPPLRTREHQEALWAGIADGTVDCISTDHAPHTLDEKNCDDPLKAPSGVPGVETMIPLLLTAVHEKKLSYTDVHRLCFTNPNRIFGLEKQGIVAGLPADLVLVDPTAEWTIHAKDLHSKCGWTPYEGWRVYGKIVPLACRP